MAAEHTGLFGDTHFWVLLATILFVIVAFKKGRTPLLDMLDKRTARIKADLEEAERLRIEAQDLLSDTQKKHRDAIQTAQQIIDNAGQIAERLGKEAERKLEETLKRKEAQLLERISRAESSAVQELQHQAADIAARSAEKILQDAMGKRGAKLVDESIAEIAQKLH